MSNHNHQINPQFQRLVKLTWQEKARETYKYHAQRVKENPKHRIVDTAKELKRSEGGVNEDIVIASWLRTHKQLEESKSRREALEFIRSRKHKLLIESLDYE